MGETLNNLTLIELLGILASIVAVYKFIELIISPLVRKWLKIDKNASDLSVLKALPDRIRILESKAERDFKRLNTIDDVNVLMVEALQALVRNRITNNDVSKLKSVGDKIDGFLAGRVRS